MTIDEKIEKLKKDTLEYARKMAAQIISEQENNIENIKKEHIDSLSMKANLSIKAVEENLKHEENKIISKELVKLKRAYNDKLISYKNEIFDEVKSKLYNYIKTPDYENLLIKWINEATTFAENDEIYIYINPSDEDKKESLEKNTNAIIKISSYDFIGGTRAVIRNRNVLIDHSFSSILEKQIETFHFEEELIHE